MNNFYMTMAKQWNYICYGDTIRIDASSLCQLHCPVCQTWRLQEKVGAGYLKYEDFKKFVDTYENFKYIEISNDGEIFLNPELNRIIEYAFRKGILLSAENGVNLNSICDETVESLVKYQFGPINVSIDGASDATYAIYRRGGSFTRVIDNIRKINVCKQKYCSGRPELTWRFIIFGHNEHEIETARKMAEELNMRFELLFNVEPNYSPVKDEKYVSEQMGFHSVQEWKESQNKSINSPWFCQGLWERIQINWDGRLLGCCRHKKPFTSNVFKSGLKKTTKSKEYMYTKKMLTGRMQPQEDIECSKCQTFKLMVKKRVFVNDRAILIERLKKKFFPEAQVRGNGNSPNFIESLVFSGVIMRRYLGRIKRKVLKLFFNLGESTSQEELSGNIDIIDGQRVTDLESAISLGTGKNHIVVSGWTIDSVLKMPVDEAYVCIERNEYKASFGINRTDVALHFNEPALQNCGFSSIVPIDAFVEGINNISIKTISGKNRTITAGISLRAITIKLPRNALFFLNELYNKDLESDDPISFPSVEKPSVSIIVLGSNLWNHTRNCFRSIIRNTEMFDYEVIFVDNGSTDETSEQIKHINNIVYMPNQTDAGFARGRNQGGKIAHGEYLVFLDNDIYVLPEWLSSMIKTFSENQNVGAVGSKLIFSNGRLAEAGGIVWKDKSTDHYGRYQKPYEYQYNYVKDVDYCSASAMMVKAEIFRSLGGFDDTFDLVDCDIDFCFRVRKIGLRVVYQPRSEVICAESLTAGRNEKQEQFDANREKFSSRWTGTINNENCASTEGDYFARDRSNPGRIILYIDHCIPCIDQDGASFITYQYLKAMKSLGYKIVFWPQDLDAADPYTMILQQMGIEVVYGDVSFDEYVKRNGTYINISFVAQPMGSLPYLDLLRKYTKSKIFYMAHDLHFLREMRGRDFINNVDEEEIEKTKTSEMALMKKSDKALFFSNKEVEYLKTHYPEIRAESIPWIQEVDNSAIRSDKRFGLLFVGAFGHMPNNDAVEWFHKEIFPLISREIINIKTFIVGSNPPESIKMLDCNNFNVIGYKKVIDSYFDNSKIFIAPIRFGAGFKTKIARAMSHGLPVVTTSMGAEGMGLTDGENVCIADDAQTFAEKVVELYNNESLWDKISSNSVKHVGNNYSPENALEYLEKHLLS